MDFDVDNDGPQGLIDELLDKEREIDALEGQLAVAKEEALRHSLRVAELEGGIFRARDYLTSDRRNLSYALHELDLVR